MMTDTQIKKLAITKLAENGVKLPANAAFRVIARAIGELIGKPVPYEVSQTDYVKAWACPAQSTKYVKPFRKMRPMRHPRQADIDAAQPPMMSMKGVGNWNQYAPTMLNNGNRR